MDFFGSDIAIIPCPRCGYRVTLTPPVRHWRKYETHRPDGFPRVTPRWAEVAITCENCGYRFHVKFWN